MRALCKVFGCWCHEEYPGCGRCGAALYDADFYQEPIWVVAMWRHLKFGWEQKKFHRSHNCAVCGSKMFFTDDHCCSTECYDNWVPF